MVGKVAVSASLLVSTDHSTEQGRWHISFGDVSQDQMILPADQNSDLNVIHYYP